MIREPRQVGTKTILDLVLQKRILFTVGLVFTLIPFAITAILLLVIFIVDSDTPAADYQMINNNGKLTTAIVTDIQTQSNVTINNEHPSIISYRYIRDNREANGRYRSLDPDRISRMNIGDTIQIKYLAESSMIIGLEPFEFPFEIFFKIMVPFLIVGVIALVFLYLKVRNEIDLFRYGEVRDAELVSMIPKNGLPISRIGQGVAVHYKYKTSRGQTVLGESFAKDYSMLNSKRQGDKIKVFVSPQNESKSCLIPKLEQVRNNWKIEL